jgi:hypothetical protein
MAPFRQTTLPAHLNPAKHAGPEYCEAVINYMSRGYSLSAFCGSILVERNTVYNWIKRHSEFSDAVARARMARVAWLEIKLLCSKKGAETTAAIFALRNAAPRSTHSIRRGIYALLLTLKRPTSYFSKGGTGAGSIT